MLMRISRDLNFAIEFGLHAAQTVLPMRKGLRTGDYKGHGKAQMITAADMAVCRLATKTFGEDFISEETYKGAFDKAVALLDRDTTTYVVDEVDGTTDLASGLNTWGHLIGVVRSGEVVGSVMVLPSYFTNFALLEKPFDVPAQEGLMLVGTGKICWIYRLRGGAVVGQPKEWKRPERATYYTSVSAVESMKYRFDYTRGLLPRSECACIADFTMLALGKTIAATFGSKLWDVAGAKAVLDALGCQWYRVGDMSPPPENFVEMFGPDFTAKDSWIISPDAEAAKLVNAALA